MSSQADKSLVVHRTQNIQATTQIVNLLLLTTMPYYDRLNDDLLTLHEVTIQVYRFAKYCSD
jgi:hypothetical protein